MFRLPELPYQQSAFAPWLSAESFEFHYGKHHKAYIDKMNDAIKGTPKSEQSLEQIVKEAQAGLFNNSAQAWNHTFFWHCISASKKGLDTQKTLADAIQKDFGSVDEFKKKFQETAVGQFGSGWAWLVKNSQGKLEVIGTANADTPFVKGLVPVLTCDVWEHAYYIDHRNARPKFVEGFLEHASWEFAAKNYAGNDTPNMTQFMR